MIGVVTDAMDAYNTPKACREVIEFINELSTWYVRRSRDRIKNQELSIKNQVEDFGSELTPHASRLTPSTQALETLGYVLARTCQVLAPIAPFLSDYIYRDVTGESSVHLTTWPEAETRDKRQGTGAEMDTRILEQMQLVRDVVSLVLSVRKSSGISVRQPLRAFGYKSRSSVALSEEHVQLILEELNIKQLEDFDSLVEMGSHKGGVRQVAGAGSVTDVALDTVLTEELKLEGYARELERVVQDLRKKAGLKVGETIDLYYNTQNKDLEKVLLELLDRKKTFVSNITQSLEVEADEEMQATVDSMPVWMGIVRK